MPFILDASVTLAWAFEDENNPVADAVRQALQTGAEAARVPDLWWYEVRNILIVGERRGRLTQVEMSQFLQALSNLPIEISPIRNDQPLLGFARQYGLTVYDAAYLALAVRDQLPLATLDQALRNAAQAEGVLLLG